MTTLTKVEFLFNPTNYRQLHCVLRDKASFIFPMKENLCTTAMWLENYNHLNKTIAGLGKIENFFALGDNDFYSKFDSFLVKKKNALGFFIIPSLCLHLTVQQDLNSVTFKKASFTCGNFMGGFSHATRKDSFSLNRIDGRPFSFFCAFKGFAFCL